MSGFKKWYSGMSKNEKTMVIILVISIMLLLISLFVVKPLKESYKIQMSDGEYYSSQLPTIKRQVASMQGGQVSANGQLNQIMSSSAKSYGLKFSSIQERKRNQEVQVSLDDVEFDRLIRWISELEQSKGFVVANFRASNTDAQGLVDASIKILRAN